MKTIYRKTSRNRPPYLVPVIFVACIALCIVAILFRTALTSIFWRVGEPVAAFGGAFEHSGILAQFSSKAELMQENIALRAQLASTTLALADRDALYKENLLLKGRSARPASSIEAAVLMRPPATPYDTFILDAGLQEGVARGDKVSGGGAGVIGTISDVYTTTSRAVLFSAPGNTYNAVIRTNDGASLPISVSGQGGGSMSGQVPFGSNVHVGDLLLLPGTQSQFSATVSYTVQKEGSFQMVYFHQPVNIFELASVSIIHSPIR